MMMSQSALRIWYVVMIQSSFSETPSSCASAWPSSTWKPGGSPALLANGSEFGWAHSPIVPNERMVVERARLRRPVEADDGADQQRENDLHCVLPCDMAFARQPIAASMPGCN